jgi:hypothetical protein
MFEDTKGVVRSHKLKKDRKFSGQKDKQWSKIYYTENQTEENEPH